MTCIHHRLFFFFVNGAIIDVNISLGRTADILSVTGRIDSVEDVSKPSNKIGTNHDFHVEAKVSPPSRYQLF